MSERYQFSMPMQNAYESIYAAFQKY
uniref:Uncharacterized protein n=1 Tax=Anguilla anguilla TaxID=7936 RepID=A0A0E9VHC8_ANGAN